MKAIGLTLILQCCSAACPLRLIHIAPLLLHGEPPAAAGCSLMVPGNGQQKMETADGIGGLRGKGVENVDGRIYGAGAIRVRPSKL